VLSTDQLPGGGPTEFRQKEEQELSGGRGMKHYSDGTYKLLCADMTIYW